MIHPFLSWKYFCIRNKEWALDKTLHCTAMWCVLFLFCCVKFYLSWGNYFKTFYIWLDLFYFHYFYFFLSHCCCVYPLGFQINGNIKLSRFLWAQMANIKYLFPKDNFPFISPPRHVRHVSWPRVISPCCSAHPVPELRRHRARQREPAALHGPRPGRGHQLQRTAGQIFFCSV